MITRRLLGHLPVNIAQAVAGFGAVAAFTRLLDPADYGRYTLVLVASQLAHTLTITWAEAAAFRFHAHAKSQNRLADHFATLKWIILGVQAASVLVIAALWLLLRHDPPLAVAACLAAGASAMRFVTRISRETDRADHNVARYSWRETAFTLLGLALGIACAATTQLGPGAPFLGLLIGGAFIAAADLPFLLKSAKGGVGNTATALQYGAYGVPLALALSLELAVQTGARFVINANLGAEAVGAFAAAFGLARTIDLLFVWASMSAAPLALTAFESGGRAKALPIARGLASTLFALAIPAAVGLALVAQPLAHTMVGEGLAATAAELIPWLAISGLFAGLSTYYFSEAFQLTRRTGLRAVVMIVPAILTLILVALWSPSFGLVGAAAATALATAGGTVLLALVGRRLLPLPIPWLDAARALAASAVMAIGVWFVPDFGGWLELLAKAGAGALLYALAGLALNVAGARPIVGQLLQTLWRRIGVKLNRSKPPTPDQGSP
ncbi:MAG: lipopolysaccharide biosynthesis protein [Caulobacterales bacterium]